MELIERTFKALHEVDERMATTLLPYGVTLGAYFATLTRKEKVAPLPAGVVDAAEFLNSYGQLSALPDTEEEDAEMRRTMGACWRCAFANRIDFETRMTPLLMKRYELELQLCLAKAQFAVLCTSSVPCSAP